MKAYSITADNFLGCFSCTSFISNVCFFISILIFECWFYLNIIFLSWKQHVIWSLSRSWVGSDAHSLAVGLTNTNKQNSHRSQSVSVHMHKEKSHWCLRTTPTGKARTAIIQSRSPMSFFSCLSCSILALPFVNRLERSVKTQTPKNTAWMTWENHNTRFRQLSKMNFIVSWE